MPPIIGITTNQVRNEHGQETTVLTEAYSRAIMGAGGVPVLIPSVLETAGWSLLFRRLDGILFSGGGDIDPGRFAGEQLRDIAGLDRARDVLEFGLLQMATSAGKPFLGICRGCQLLNVGVGGTLYTHIPRQLPGALNHQHPGNERTVLVHEVRLEEGTRLGQILGQSALMVNSHHLQGLKDLGTGLRVVGRAPDGLVEAIELPDHRFGVGVQWHPEWLTDQLPTRNLFRRFVEASAEI